MNDSEITSSEHNAEYSIDELARVAGATVRNVRAYQDRGILPPPERRGRSGIYTHAHLARLRMIGQLLGRGYSIANIGELIAAWEQGQDVSQLLGLESAITSPWSDETPTYYEALELLSFFGKDVTQEEILQACQLGIIEFVGDGTRFKVASPRLLHVGKELVSLGLPLKELLLIIDGLRDNVNRVANMFVEVIARLIDEETAHLAEIIWKMRPLADVAVDAEVARAMELAINNYFGERLDSIMQSINNKQPKSV